MFNQTSFISVLLLSICLIWTFKSRTAAEIENVENSKFSNHFQRVKRQFNGNNFDGGFGGGFGGGGRRRGQVRRPFFPNNANNFGGPQQPFNGGNNQLIFSGNPNQGQQPNNAQPPTQPPNNNNNNNNNDGNNQSGQLVFINNRPTIATVAPFTGRTTATPQFLTCFNSCRTTSEYNPICGSDQELYFNEQKFNCAQRCGANIQIVRRGSCQGLFPMMRG